VLVYRYCDIVKYRPDARVEPFKGIVSRDFVECF
jgi:hypothetical protein